MNVQEKVRAHIVNTFLTADDADSFHDDDDLLEILNSLQILRMIIDFERAFSIKIDNSEFTTENLGSVQKLAALISRHLA